jgi:hypothetical protein
MMTCLLIDESGAALAKTDIQNVCALPKRPLPTALKLLRQLPGNAAGAYMKIRETETESGPAILDGPQVMGGNA